MFEFQYMCDLLFNAVTVDLRFVSSRHVCFVTQIYWKQLEHFQFVTTNFGRDHHDFNFSCANFQCNLKLLEFKICTPLVLSLWQCMLSGVPSATCLPLSERLHPKGQGGERRVVTPLAALDLVTRGEKTL